MFHADHNQHVGNAHCIKRGHVFSLAMKNEITATLAIRWLRGLLPDIPRGSMTGAIPATGSRLLAGEASPRPVNEILMPKISCSAHIQASPPRTAAPPRQNSFAQDTRFSIAVKYRPRTMWPYR
jgi:hypothetical protein